MQSQVCLKIQWPTKSSVFIETFSIFSGDLGFPNFETMPIFLVAFSFSCEFVDCLMNKNRCVSKSGALKSCFSTEMNRVIRWSTLEVEHGTWRLILPGVDSLPEKKKQKNIILRGFQLFNLGLLHVGFWEVSVSEELRQVLVYPCWQHRWPTNEWPNRWHGVMRSWGKRASK